MIKPFFKRFDGSVDTLLGWRCGVDIGTRKFALEASTVVGRISRERYLGRWFISFGWGTIRLHKFYRGDNDRAPHTHPWSFITFPLSSYVEHRFDKGVDLGLFVVKAFRFHYRPVTFEHIVLGRVKMCGCGCGNATIDPKPFYTIVIGGNKSNEWGFYPEPGEFVHHKDFLNVDQ